MEYCDNCQKQIEQAKFSLHIGYCRRNIIRCNKCRVLYDKNELQQHEEEYHQIKETCKYCSVRFNQSEMKKHESSCHKAKKDKACQYCELPVPQANFDQHMSYCEARTSNCEICSRAITNKNYFNHLIQCQQQQHHISSQPNIKYMEMQNPVTQKYAYYDNQRTKEHKIQESVLKRYPTQVTRIVYQPGTSTIADGTVRHQIKQLEGRSYVSSVRRQIPIQRTISQSSETYDLNTNSQKSTPISQSKSYSYSYVQSNSNPNQTYSSLHTYTTTSSSQGFSSMTTANLSSLNQGYPAQNYYQQSGSLPSFMNSANSQAKSEFSNYRNNQEFQNTFGQSGTNNGAFLQEDAQLQAALMASLVDSGRNN